MKAKYLIIKCASVLNKKVKIPALLTLCLNLRYNIYENACIHARKITPRLVCENHFNFLSKIMQRLFSNVKLNTADDYVFFSNKKINNRTNNVLK